MQEMTSEKAKRILSVYLNHDWKFYFNPKKDLRIQTSIYDDSGEETMFSSDRYSSFDTAVIKVAIRLISHHDWYHDEWSKASLND